MVCENNKNHLTKIALPEALDPRILSAASVIYRKKIAYPILIGDENLVHSVANSNEIDISSIPIVSPYDLALKEDFTNYLKQQKKYSNLSQQEIKLTIENSVCAAMVMAGVKKADGVVAGATHSTAEVLSSALKIIGLAPSSRLASSFFLMENHSPTKTYPTKTLYADCALVIDPSVDELVDIAHNTYECAKIFLDEEPCIAFLSFSTAGSANHPKAIKVHQAGERLKKMLPMVDIIAEVQFDAAVSLDVLRIKSPKMSPKKSANVFIFPNLEAGNIGYKIAKMIGNLTAVGPIIHGLARPVNDLSRSANIDEIIKVCAITAKQAQYHKG